MANNKKRINWIEIKARYLAGEKPADIAKDYKDCTAEKVSQKAKREKWTTERDQLRQNLTQYVEDAAKALADRVLEEYRRIAFSDMRKFNKWGPDGVQLISCEELTEEEAACVAEVSETTTKDGGSIRLKLHNKMSALDSLAKHLGLFKEEDKNGSSSTDGATYVLKIQRQSDTERDND